jgi:hypothetical protein
MYYVSEVLYVQNMEFVKNGFGRKVGAEPEET